MLINSVQSLQVHLLVWGDNSVGKLFSVNAWEHEFTSRNHIKNSKLNQNKPGMVAETWNNSTEEAEVGPSLQLTWQSSWLGEFQASEKLTFKRQGS